MTAIRAERAGIGASAAGHVLLFAALYYLADPTPRPHPPEPPSMEVSLVSETGLVSGAPEISTEAPAPKLAEEDAPITPEPPAPLPLPERTPVPAPEPVPAPKPLPKPTPQPVPKPAPKPLPPKPLPKVQPKPPAKPAPAPAAKTAQRQAAPPKAAPAGGRLAGILNGLTDDNSRGRATRAQATTITPAIQSSIIGAVVRQLRPHWEPPTGADANLLKTTVQFRLSRDGKVLAVSAEATTGVTPSNRAQVSLHRERAIRAVRLAAPFKLPAEFYDGPSGWNNLEIEFDARL